MKRLIKFDIVHPGDYLKRKQAQWGRELDAWTLREYQARLNRLRSNYSDYYTAPLNATGEWDAEEYYLLDPVFTRKVARECLTAYERVRARVRGRWYKMAFRTGLGYDMAVAEYYIRARNPDVLFVRSQPIPSPWWRRFRRSSLLVARLSARMPRRWHPEDFDLVYTDQPDFKRFFDLHGVDTRLNRQGFDVGVADELRPPAPDGPDVSFVGGLGRANFLARTTFLESLQSERSFPWWGYWWEGGAERADFPRLAAAHRGATSGLEMYQVFRDTKVNLNDYVDTANGIGFNQRIFEVLGVGGFLLTRAAPNFARDFPGEPFATYTDRDDCLRKIDYYLAHEGERRAIAEQGRALIAERYDFRDIAEEFGRDLGVLLAQRGHA